MDMKLEKGVNGGANNASQTNGHLTDRNAQGGTRGEAKQQTAKRQSNMATFSKLRKASRRPLPTERGDGTYREVLQRPTLMQDLRSLSLAGACPYYTTAFYSMLTRFCRSQNSQRYHQGQAERRNSAR